MPAAAVIPAPKAYIKVVAVKTSVVEFTPFVLAAGPSLGWMSQYWVIKSG